MLAGGGKAWLLKIWVLAQPRRPRTKNATVVLFAAAGLMTAGCGGSSDTTPPPPAKNSAEAPGWGTQAISEVTAGQGVQLKLVKFVKEFEGGDYSYITPCREGEVPPLVNQNSSGAFCFGSYHKNIEFIHNDTAFYLYYDILVPDSNGGWQPTGFYADMATKVARAGESKIECNVRPAGGTEAAAGAAFRCKSWLTGEGSDRGPHWEVTTNPVKEIDASKTANVQEAAALIKANCQRFDTFQCSWTRTAKSTAFAPSKSPSDQPEWIPLTSEADSCPPTSPDHPFELTFEKSTEVGWSDEVGGKISGEISGDALIAKVKAGVEASYSHSIERKVEEKETYKYTIPYKYRSALFMLHGYLTVTGEFAINTPSGDRYLIKNATFQFPLSQSVDVQDTQGGHHTVQRSVVIHADKPCDNTNPPTGVRATQKIGVLSPVGQ